MIPKMYQKTAEIAVKHSVEVKKDDRVLIMGPALAKELFQSVYLEVIKAGAHPITIPELEGMDEIFYTYASDEQLEYVDPILIKLMEEIDCLINIRADYNTKKLSSIDPKRIGKKQKSPANKELMKIYMQRDFKGELKWVIIPYPCHAYAQEAEMDMFSYTEFIRKALLLDKEDPIQEWRDIEKKQDEIIEYLDKVENMKVLGEDTELNVSVKGRTWINCCGHRNLPDGEVYTGPVEDKVDGHIRFTYPGIYSGKEIRNIYLEFEEGKVVNATAEKGQELLDEVLSIDNADRLGEFAIATNFGIKKFTKNMLFDEKMGGTIHCALGMGFPRSGSNNQSPIHWDILKDMRVPGSKIFADGDLIYEEGEWKI